MAVFCKKKYNNLILKCEKKIEIFHKKKLSSCFPFFFLQASAPEYIRKDILSAEHKKTTHWGIS